ncbi:aspartate ammonia-lyase [Candidatus Roizmanbacteria bacterium]|nr:MAG: aspartate ammonia-lyase [Candidatus Roizmanbacteria bacterium]
MKIYGEQTNHALENFPFDVPKVSLELVYAITVIKKAAASAHHKVNELDTKRKDAIITACDEILAGKHDDQFPVSSLQGGAGTSINMNVNEVIASRASELAKTSVHPNDHVNMGQSTNDVNPTALRIVCLELSHTLMEKLKKLSKAYDKKIKLYGHVKKLARTHMQDAIPTTVGSEIGAWKGTVDRDIRRLTEFQPYLYEIHLGGTAIGSGMNASRQFRRELYKELNKLVKDSGIRFKPAENMFSFTSTTSDFVHLSNLITLLAGDLSKIAHDIRFLTSGPRGGIGEYILQPLQKGSSIMPGKVNPVIPEVMNQIYYQISGKNLAVQMANETSDLQLAVMFPTVADSVITSFKLLIVGVDQFTEKCIRGLTVDPETCRNHLESSTAYSTLLVPILGYDKVAEVVKKTIQSGKGFRQVLLEDKIIGERELENLLSGFTVE